MYHEFFVCGTCQRVVKVKKDLGFSSKPLSKCFGVFDNRKTSNTILNRSQIKRSPSSSISRE